MTRKAEAYTRAQQSMARYQKELGQLGSAYRSASSAYSQQWGYSDWDEDFRSVDEEDEAEPSDRRNHRGSVDTGDGEDDCSSGGPAGDIPDGHRNDPWYSWGRYNDGWDYSDWSWVGSGYRRWNRRSQADSTEWSRRYLPEILPDFIQGWYLFMDSGLDVMERNVLQAELRGQFGVRAVEDVLRKHWNDGDLKRRDREKGKHHIHMADAMEDTAEMACYGGLDSATLQEEGFAAEEIEVLMSEETNAEEAYAMIQEGRRTLQAARAKQHAVRTARQFYPVASKMPSSATASGLRPVKCFRCGGPHKIAQCPEKPRERTTMPTGQGHLAASEQAPFVFLAEAHDQVHAMMSGSAAIESDVEQSMLSTQEAVEQGKAVLDGGATKTIGSVHALTRVLKLNEGKRGADGLVDLDLEDRPSFGFGNSSREQCVSTASLSVPLNGRDCLFRVHALDKGTAPILLSIHSLRALGAIVDFEQDLAIFRHVDDRKVLKLERTQAGHQVLPLTEDIFEGAQQLASPMPSLKDWI